MAGSPANLEEIAKAARLSKTTVSLILNDKGDQYRINPKTQERVVALARSRGYAPNQNARSLRMDKTQTLGLVVPDLTNYFFAELSKAFEAAARRGGFEIFITCSDDSAEIERNAIRNLYSRKVDGLVVASVASESALADYEAHVPTVFIDRQPSGRQHSWITSDNHAGARLLIDHLIGAGKRDIWYIGGLKGLSTSKDRLAGYKAALAKHRIPFDAQRVSHGAFTWESGYQQAKALFARKPASPTCIFTASFTLFEGVMRYIQETRRWIPADLQLATFDDHPLLDFLSTRVPSVQQDCAAIAEAAFNALVSAKAAERRMRIAPRLITREP
ncbi:MAG TPA: LacI family DNA-binding transcriptional regulator [Nevskiaceae bacterium]|nr:LacI family DNA-binding transcriptional regulator [Nevskiaceae bacterium]